MENIISSRYFPSLTCDTFLFGFWRTFPLNEEMTASPEDIPEKTKIKKTKVDEASCSRK